MRQLVYQIFVDRFAGPGGTELPAVPADAPPWQHHAGGTLDGIVARLPHILALGADCLYLTPIFRAGSNHKYDTESFDEVDPAFGGEAAFDRLVAACRAHGLGLVLDGVFNHVSERHPWFLAARADAALAETGHFRFARHPDDHARWRGLGFLPELALERAHVRDVLWASETSVLRRWLRRGATGFRLDCANDLGLAACAEIAAVAREEHAAEGAIGEVMGWAEPFLGEGRLDGVMNYWFREVTLHLCRGELSGLAAGEHLAQMVARWPYPRLLRSWNLLASHDTARVASALRPQEASIARALAFCLPGVPHVYYGDEIGLTGAGDPENRAPMAWDPSRWERHVLAELQALNALRRGAPALQHGDFRVLPQPQHPALLCFARTTARADETVIVVVNPSDSTVAARLFLPIFLPDHLPVRDLRGGAATRVVSGSLPIHLPAHTVAWFTPDDSTIAGYRFLR